ncbi:MAG: methylmalonyl-CoA mutase, partial [Elusimicrobia bacterium]|nr:methylmalonyl-CoA mutase [Elusimicrobiota bacterium]
TAAVLLAFYVAVARRRGIPLGALRGTLQNDILKEFMARGTYIFPPAPSLRLVADTIEYSYKNIPNFHPISISGYHIREAGSDAVQELAFTLANAEVYLKELISRGLSVDDFGGRLAFFFGCHNHFLEEIAKFRAARKVWAKMMREDYGAQDAKTLSLRFHVQTCGSTLTSQQPHNNVVRVAIQAMAAVLGGAQSLHTNAFDEALALPTEESAQLALRTQQILAHETGVPETVDPVGGSYAIEALTAELEARVWATIKRVRGDGGMLALIEKGVPQSEIQERAYQYQKEIETGRRKIVGVNALRVDDEKASLKTLRVSPKLEQEQIRRLKAFKRRRNGQAAAQSLAKLESAAKGSDNLFPHLLHCVESHATLGEICGALRRVFGEHNAR